MILERLRPALERCGLTAFGGFHPHPDDAVPALADGTSVGTVVLIGNVGSDLWPHVAPFTDAGTDPLDRWTRRVLDPIAAGCGAQAAYPFSHPPLPFQRWAMRSAPVHRSPLGMLIHPEYGLWHAYRAAFLFPETHDLPHRLEAPSPCATCDDKPCLAACPVGAFTISGYDVAACAGHLASRNEPRCADSGCHARAACPVGVENTYREDHMRFHMAAFRRAVTADGG